MATSLRNITVIATDAERVVAPLASLTDFSFHCLPNVLPDRMRQIAGDILLVDISVIRDASRTGDTYNYNLGLESLSALSGDAPVIVLVNDSQMRAAFQAVKAGVRDYLTLPLVKEEFQVIVDGIENDVLLEREIEYLRDQVVESDPDVSFVSGSQLMRRIYDQVRRVAGTRSTVLLTGETGTGKSLLARQIHQASPRADQPFISVHCGAIPESLLESELFGHEKGAFTGAVRQKLGKFDIARGGTIFLDEIGTISPATQIKLLQVLQERTFCRIGGEEEIEADVRIIAATNDDLLELSRDGKFRQDLYYRLNVFPIYLPPLRDRLEDLSQLIDIFIARLCNELPANVMRVHEKVLDAFTAYDWPGNIRELENLLERACILEESDILMPESFPTALFSETGHVLPLPDLNGSLQVVRQRAVDEVERRYLHELLTSHHGKISATAEAAGVGTRQLHKLMLRHGLQKRDYK